MCNLFILSFLSILFYFLFIFYELELFYGQIIIFLGTTVNLFICYQNHYKINNINNKINNINNKINNKMNKNDNIKKGKKIIY